MPSRGACPMCGYAFEREAQLAETRGRCPACGVMLQIPAPRESQGRERTKPLPGPSARRGSPDPAETADHRSPDSGVAEAAGPSVANLGGVGRPAPSGSPASPARTPWSMPAWGWIGLAVVGLAVVIGLGLFFSPGPAPPSRVSREIENDEPSTPEKPAADDVKTAASLEDVLKAIVKFEVPMAGGTRVQYGCGFLIDRRGWIATSHHVVAGATTDARVRFADGTECKLAGLVARSPERDLAIVQLAQPPPEMTILDIRFDETPRLGRQVYAFGHPYNADFSLSKGIVSRVLTTADLLASNQNRVVTAIGAPKDLVWIQHDAKISPGNSGGPLLEEDGRVVGVNTFIHVKAEFGYASHVRYLRELAATASDEPTPLPQPRPLALAAGEDPSPLPPGRVVVSVGRMKQLFDAGRAFGWTPQQADQYETLAELAKQMTWAKHLQAISQAVEAPPQAIQRTVGLADQLFVELGRAVWGPDQSQAINQFAADRVDTPGEGAMLVATVLGSVQDTFLLLEIRGRDQRVLVPVGSKLSRSPRGTPWLVIGLISPKTAQIKHSNDPKPQRLPIVVTRYMLRVK